MIDRPIREATVEMALRFLSGRDQDRAAVRNDIGFNAADTAWGNRLASLLDRRGAIPWRPGEYRDAKERLRKYMAQLAEGGIVWANIPIEPPTGQRRPEGQPARMGAKIEVSTASDAPPTAKPMQAQKSGICAACRGSIDVGGLFVWGQAQGAREHWPTCPSGRSEAHDQPRVEAPSRPEPRPSEPLPMIQSRDASTAARGVTRDTMFGPDGALARLIPNYQPRTQQLQAVDAMEQGMRQGKAVVVEAGTGTGKSHAYGSVAVLDPIERRVVISTADKGLQAQLRDKDIPLLAEAYQAITGRTLTWSVLKGVSNFVCQMKVAEMKNDPMLAFKSRESADAWPAVEQWIKQTTTGDAEECLAPMPGDLRQEITTDTESCIGSKCEYAATCWSRVAKAKAQESRLVVVNHSLMLRDAEVRYRSLGEYTMLGDYGILVIDEAHRLGEIATDAFAIDLSVGRWLKLERRFERLVWKHKAVRDADPMKGEQSARFVQQSETLKNAVGVAGMEIRRYVDGLLQRMLEAKADVLELDRNSEAEHVDGPFSAISDTIKAMSNPDLSLKLPAWIDSETPQAEQWKKLRAQVMDFLTALVATTGAGMQDTADFMPGWVRFAQIEGEEGKARLVLYAKPIDVAPLLRRRLFSGSAAPDDDVDFDLSSDYPDADPSGVGVSQGFRPLVLATSATIASGKGPGAFGFWQRTVGLDDALTLQVPAPFDYASVSRLYIPSDAERFVPPAYGSGADKRDVYEYDLSERMLALAEACPGGGVFFLFTSTAMMRSVYRRIGSKLEQSGRLVLMQGQGGLSRPALVDRFKRDGEAVLFGLKSFWEGVDIQGDALSLVVIDKLPFVPPQDPVWAARRERIDREAGKGASFSQLDVPNAILALKQAHGRLIRTVTDRGVVALMDGRVKTRQYGRLILEALPPSPVVGTVAEVAAFFGGGMTAPVGDGYLF